MTSNCLENSLRWVFETRSFLFQPLGIEETQRTFIVRCKLVPCELATLGTQRCDSVRPRTAALRQHLIGQSQKLVECHAGRTAHAEDCAVVFRTHRATTGVLCAALPA